MKKRVKDFILRILATFVATALGVIGAGAIAGVDVLKACLMAGIAGVASVIEKIARRYMEDGELTNADIDAAFGEVAALETVVPDTATEEATEEAAEEVPAEETDETVKE